MHQTEFKPLPMAYSCPVLSHFTLSKVWSEAQGSSACIVLPVQWRLNVSKTRLSEVHGAGTVHFNRAGHDCSLISAAA